MKKLYFIVPIVLLAIFIFFWVNAKNGIHAKEEARQAKIIKDQEERQRKEEAARKVAWEQANAEAQRRIEEYNERQRKEKEQNEQKTLLTDQRDIAFRENNTLSTQVKQLTDDLQLAKQQKGKIEEQIKIQKTQVDYLKTAVKDVVQNKTAFQTALEKLEAAEQAFARAEQQRAQAARPPQK